MNYELASKLWYYSEGEIYWNLSIGQQKKGKIAGYKHEKAFYKHVNIRVNITIVIGLFTYYIINIFQNT